MKKRLLATGLVLLMLVALMAGCQSTTSSTTAGGTTKATTATQAAATTTKAKETVKLVFYNNSGAANVSGAEAGSSKEGYKKIQDYVLAKTGILVEAILPPQEGSAEKLALLLSGGSQLDMWYGKWPEYYTTGAIQPVTSYVKAASFAKVYKLWDDWDAWVGVTDPKGNIWGTPRNTPATPYPVFCRVDWLDKLGMKMPTTFEELNKYLYAVKAADPYGNGSTVALAANKFAELEYAFLGGYVKTGNGMWLDSKGNVNPACTADGYVNFLTQVYTWYKDGILHPECFSWDTNTLRSYTGSGKAAATACWYSRVTLESANTTTNAVKAGFDLTKYPYVYWINEKGIKGPNGELMQTHTNADAECLLVSAKCKNVQSAMDFIAWSFDWYNYTVEAVGIEGEHWNYDTSDPDAKKNNKIIQTGKGNAYYRDFVASLGVPMEIQTTTFDAWKRQDEHNLWLQKWHNNFAATKDPGCEYGLIWDTAVLEKNVPNTKDIKAYMAEQLVLFATGKRNLSEYSNFIQELNKIGLADYIKEYTRQYNSYGK